MSNQKIMETIIPFYDLNAPEKACEKLYTESLQLWRVKSGVVDDITTICIFLNEY
jgi:hypothetical protein